eukprot:Nk52_evm35s222 gene=Nk52_evmTU35s222
MVRAQTQNSSGTPEYDIVVLEGDYVGPEVCKEAVEVLKTVADSTKCKFNFIHELIGGAAIDATGEAISEATLDSCKKADAVLLGAVGGPKWANSPVRPEAGLLKLRKEMNLFANLRPVVSSCDEMSAEASPLKAEKVKGVDFVVVRELTGGIYFGARKEATEEDPNSWDRMEYSVEEIKRITRVAAELALKRKKKITSVDKANVLACSRLWRKVVSSVIAEEYPDIVLEHILVDAAAMHLLQKPNSFDVILTSNLFGDILSDESSVLTGSLGLLPSASLSNGGKGLYEPIHGSAPDIAGKNVANPIGMILSVAMLLRHGLEMHREASLVERAVSVTLAEGHRTGDIAGKSDKVLGTKEFCSVVIQNLKKELSRTARPMTLSEKILCDHAIGLTKAEVKPGQMICVKVDWTLASELTWKGMEKTYSQMGRPKIWRNDRFWLAIDHTVDPSINHLEKPKGLIKASQDFANEAELVDFYGPNQTILHTEFYRTRAQPGMIVVGADSHSCSTGGLGAWAVGLGAADVVMPLVTGETWVKVPETVNINYQGELPFGIGGKDVILYTMGVLKRNTVAFERAVEYTGNIKQLSCDARFAIANMTTEFGGIVGVFPADEVTAAYISKRRRKEDKDLAKYLRPDPDAEYAQVCPVDLGRVDSMVALYPSPDNVVPVTEVEGMDLNGVFIGACTTAEEDLILGGLVLKEMMKDGFKPEAPGKRKVTPGSVSILAKLRRLGLISVYEAAGFEIGAPGCSYCLGIAADVAGEGEVWLSSQNRNFRNRMGKGSIGNLASAATVAASSFSMQVSNPRKYLDAIDRVEYKEMLDLWVEKQPEIEIVEPNPDFEKESVAQAQLDAANGSKDNPTASLERFTGKVQLFEDNIDTDAIIPAEFMPGINDEDLGTHAFQHVDPEFVGKVKNGYNIVVAGVGFGSGSSREEAPRALKGCGVKAVIAKSYAYIYSRNQPNMGLLGITLTDEKFYSMVRSGSSVTVDLPNRCVEVDNVRFPFELSQVEERLLQGGGVLPLYQKYEKSVFRHVTSEPKGSVKGTKEPCGSSKTSGGCSTDNGKDSLVW